MSLLGFVAAATLMGLAACSITFAIVDLFADRRLFVGALTLVAGTSVSAVAVWAILLSTSYGAP